MERGGKRFKKKHRSKNHGMEPTPLDMEITKYLRFQVPRKSTMMQKQAVEYFVGSKAVDVLMDSKWATRKKGVDLIFVVREDAEKYLNELLQKRFFYRVMKNEKESKSKEEKEGDTEKAAEDKEPEPSSGDVSETKLRRRKKGKIEMDEEKNEDLESTKKKAKTKGKNKSREKKVKSKEKVKKRYKLTYHDEQTFYDSKDIYIWIYNPVGWRTIIMGLGVLFCVVAATLFPLWPPEVRIGVYYLSVGGGMFIGSIFIVALVRTILYGLIWAVTFGNHELWILPNILADVGFFESFKPWYSYEYKGSPEEEEEEEEQESGEEGNDDKSDGEEEEAKEENSQKSDSQSENSTAASENESAPH